ncbi:SEL1-like repeat protein [Paraliomyxa miuraensis]|uniref:hypothetical protein n=1 Tax=Paraliomyxa miuraensis TaxID=376150 RepID=UPI0022526AAC|nr:hypothetical protein [Paraliomyxa miuraensis]MCX4241114.1 hypothetical protein [Paraliomyxa miuraensis]
MRSLAISTIVLLLAACPPRSDATVDPEPTDHTSAPAANEGAAAPSCAELPPAESAQAAAEQGMQRLEQSRDGEHYLSGPFEEAMAQLRTAAEQGHREAQSLYGRTLFEVRFLAQAPTPEEREDYVAAFTFLRIAALRGDPAVDGYLPGLGDPQPLVTEEPLSQLPAEWLAEAWANADAWMTCHGSIVGDRGAQ